MCFDASLALVEGIAAVVLLRTRRRAVVSTPPTVSVVLYLSCGVTYLAWALFIDGPRPLVGLMYCCFAD